VKKRKNLKSGEKHDSFEKKHENTSIFFKIKERHNVKFQQILTTRPVHHLDQVLNIHQAILAVKTSSNLQ